MTGPTSLNLPARDGYGLAAAFHEARDPRGVVVVNGATGVPHRFYRRFAASLAEAGYSTLTYDYRGIGESRRGSLRGFPATMSDWTFLDMAGVLGWIVDEFPESRLFLVGHSFGGQVAGMLEGTERLAGMVTMSSQSGYWRLQGAEQKWLAGLHVHVTLPAMVRLFGYAPWSRFASGEDLPGGVARQWARWCRQPGYLRDDETLPLERFARFSAPVLAYSFSDDKWGTARSVDAMMSVYPSLERRHVIPSEVGLESIGHMGYFRPEAQTLWGDVVAWFDDR